MTDTVQEIKDPGTTMRPATGRRIGYFQASERNVRRPTSNISEGAQEASYAYGAGKLSI